jgi:hypothetical protein
VALIVLDEHDFVELKLPDIDEKVSLEHPCGRSGGPELNDFDSAGGTVFPGFCNLDGLELR